MSKAFKCDRCGGFQEGSPCRRKYRSYMTSGFTGWTDATTIEKAELCSDCAEQLDKRVSELLSGECNE